MKLKILLIILILVPLPFSCEDKNECLDLYVDPYFDIQNVEFVEVDEHFEHKGYLNLNPISQDYDNMVYPCDSLALMFMATDMIFHARHTKKQPFCLMSQAYAACEQLRAGYKGTFEKIDKIYVSSNYDFDMTHNKGDNLDDIIDIFAYTTSGENTWMKLSEFNKNSPYEAPNRFYLLIKRKPTRSFVQQFVIRYIMYTEPGYAPEYYTITTPVFNVR
ncbi:MAG: hypothetical protein LBQ60_03135 [Bacteroidales bacterium]|jgi:hypothetical protein|nr:hypothetical protein [Bacteroidales bacterium]